MDPIPSPGDFQWHPDSIMLENMYKSISELNLWNWLSNFEANKETGFVWTENTKEIDAISHRTIADGHSGASFAISMRNMEYIAKNGWSSYYYFMRRSIRT